MEDKKYTYIQSFAGLRGIAVLMVIFYHIVPQFVRGGFLGVIIFFVLAGFLMMRKFTDEKQVDLQNDLMKRWMKLYPQLIFMVVLICAVSMFLLPGKYSGTKWIAVSSLLSVNNYYQIIHKISYFDAHGAFTPFRHLWALSMEMQFYLIFSVIIKILMEKVKRNYIEFALIILSFLSGTMMCAVYLYTKDASLVYYAFSTRLFSFTIGALVSYQMRRKYHVKWEHFNKNIFANVFFFSMLMMAYIATADQTFQYVIGLFLYSIMVAWFLALIYHGDTWVAKWLEARPFVFLGSISFELYLWQYPISAILYVLLAHTKMAFIWNVIIQLAVTFLVAIGVHYLFRWKKLAEYLTNTKYIVIALAVAVMVVALPTFQVKDDTMNMKQVLEQRKQEQKKREQEQKNKEIAEENLKNVSDELRAQIQNLSKEYPQVAINIDKYAVHRGQKILVIGDSVMVMAQNDFLNYYPNTQIDAEVNRQFKEAPDLLKAQLQKDDYDIIVISLGTNGTFRPEDFDKIMHFAQGKKVFFVNTLMPDAWEETVNTQLASCANNYDNAFLVDWYDLAKEEEDLFYDDKTHPKEKGAKLFAQLLARYISEK